MRIKQLRLLSTCYALKSADNINEKEGYCSITRVSKDGDAFYVVKEGDKPAVIVERHRVDFAVALPGESSKVPVDKK
jgi:hypothetical protein